MEFVLTYEGALQPDGTPALKHSIRKEFHIQLKELWSTQSLLSKIKNNIRIVQEGDVPQYDFTTLDEIADNHKNNGFRIVPLVSEQFGLVCEIEILFLRRENPGGLITKSGDIDNRIKTLFDALRMPLNKEELGGYTADRDENPFFVMLENDTLITDFTVRTERLLTPSSGQNDKHVHLIIKVNTKYSGSGKHIYGFN